MTHRKKITAYNEMLHRASVSGFISGEEFLDKLSDNVTRKVSAP
jgi:hypothetical protein